MALTPSLPPTPTLPPAPLPPCRNCGAPLHGKYCHDCGQPIEGLVRHFGSVMGDVMDSVLNIDARIVHSLLPLYFRPGKLTLDYFEGKRARYVTPFRLVFFLAIIAFFAIQLTLRSNFGHYVQFDTPPVAGVSVSAKAPADTGEQDTHFANGDIKFGDKVLWNRLTKPLHLAWLPDFADDSLNDSIENARINLHNMNSGNGVQAMGAARRLMGGVFAVAPQVLFVLLPVFALLLKIFYVFKRRMYMEHLIVAMHSHAFIMLSMLVLLILDLLQRWLTPHVAILGTLMSLLHAAAWVWVFVYLFIMQKRVYRQGWFMTTVKYSFIGLFYSVLIGISVVLALVISLGTA